MKNIIKISALAFAAALVLGITGCQKVTLGTAQYSDDAVTLASYGPNPVMRGGQLRFFGSNLQEIVEVNVPGVPAITSIEVVTPGKTSEIRVTLPVEGPEVGIVSLKAKDGAVFKTKKELTYTEPIVFDGFSAAETAFPGDEITLKGDYMNLVDHVVFEGGDIAYVEAGASRHEARVIIPAKAITGRIILSDGGEVENLLYSEKELVIGKPSVTKLEDRSVKPGDEITFTGTHLEMFKAVSFRRMNETVYIEDLEVVDGKITVAVPDVASAGLVNAISYAGDEFTIVEIDCVMPSDLEVLNVPKAGADLIIDGEDLDVVTKINLAGAEDVSFDCKEGEIWANVPATATSGTAKLFHPNGEFVEVDYTIVHPTITSVSPLELYAGDEPVNVEGNDLDLIVSAKIGEKDVEITEQTSTSLTLATSVTSVSGKVSLTLANSEVIESEQEVVMKYHSLVIVTSIPKAQHIGQPVSIEGKNLKLVENIFIGDEKVTDYAFRSDEQIVFNMPWLKVGSYPVKFHLFNGDDEIQVEPIEVQLELAVTTFFEGFDHYENAWSTQIYYGKPGQLEGIAKVGDFIRIHYAPWEGNEGDYCIQIQGGSWNGWLAQFGGPDTDSGTEKVDYCGYYDLKVTADNIGILTANAGWGGVIVVQGQYFDVTKVEYISEVSQEITVYKGPCNLTWDDTGRFGIAMKYFEQCTAGSKIIFYINQNGKWGQIQLNDGGWGNSDMKFPELGNDAYIKPDFIGADVTRVELTLTEDVLSHILATPGDYFGLNTDTGDGHCGMIIQGSDWTINEVTILP